MPRPTQDAAWPAGGFAYGAITLYRRAFQRVPLPSGRPSGGPTTPAPPQRRRFGLLPFRSPLLGESRLISLPPGTEMFQFSGFASRLLGIRRLQRRGLPHSGTCGSARACQSPQLFAACRALPRLREPRHSPCALSYFRSCSRPPVSRGAFSFCLLVGKRSRARLLCFSKNVKDRWPAPLGRPWSGPGGATPRPAALRRPSPLRVTPARSRAAAVACKPTRKASLRLRCSRKEVFQPHLPVRLPCYDLAPVTGFTLGRSFRSRTSGPSSSHGLTGGVYKARERIHRAVADARLLANPASRSRVADFDPN